jgi:Domain of unknown function (DUF5680)
MALSISPTQFMAFLVNAKRQTNTAQGDDATVTPLLPGSHQLEYQQGVLCYRDIYFGSAYFVGQETVYEGPTPVWAMGYAGGVMPSSGALREMGQVYEFLRAALRHVTSERPNRGPSQCPSLFEEPFDEGSA